MGAISKIARKASASHNPVQRELCQHLLEQGIADTLVWALNHLKSRGFSVYSEALPDILNAACELANFSTQMRVRLAQSGIIAVATRLLETCHNAEAKKEATDAVATLANNVLC